MSVADDHRAYLGGDNRETIAAASYADEASGRDDQYTDRRNC
ncbi:MAG: hypothetical protein ACI8XM_002710 [Haloarculaceae archaeon]|jgi:hypothetical protein